MIGGRLNGKALAARTCCTAPNTRPITTCALSAAALRSAKGFSRTTMNAAFGALPPSSSEKPTMESKPSTCGIGWIIPSICCTNGARACHRRCVRELHGYEERALIPSGRKPVGARNASR